MRQHKPIASQNGAPEQVHQTSHAPVPTAAGADRQKSEQSADLNHATSGRPSSGELSPQLERYLRGGPEEGYESLLEMLGDCGIVGLQPGDIQEDAHPSQLEGQSRMSPTPSTVTSQTVDRNGEPATPSNDLSRSYSPTQTVPSHGYFFSIHPDDMTDELRYSVRPSGIGVDSEQYWMFRSAAVRCTGQGCVSRGRLVEQLTDSLISDLAFRCPEHMTSSLSNFWFCHYHASNLQVHSLRRGRIVDQGAFGGARGQVTVLCRSCIGSGRKIIQTTDGGYRFAS